MESADNPERPAGVTVLAWTWIISGMIMVLIGVSAARVTQVMSTMMGAQGIDPAVMPGWQAMAGMGSHGWLVVASQLVFGSLAIVAGAQFLRLRPWARSVLEVLSWLSVVYIVGFGFLWYHAWTAITMDLQIPGVQIDPAQLRMAGWIIGTVASVIVFVPLVMMIKYLRGPTVRRAIEAAARR